MWSTTLLTDIQYKGMDAPRRKYILYMIILNNVYDGIISNWCLLSENKKVA